MNRLSRIVLAVAVVVAGSLACGAASAHPRFGVDFVIGPGPLWWGPPYYYPYYYPPAVVVADPMYAQPAAPAVQVPAPPTYWYYCRQSNAYYPYVQDCPSGWEQVSPQPPAPPQAAPAPR